MVTRPGHCGFSFHIFLMVLRHQVAKTDFSILAVLFLGRRLLPLYASCVLLTIIPSTVEGWHSLQKEHSPQKYGRDTRAARKRHPHLLLPCFLRSTFETPQLANSVLVISHASRIQQCKTRSSSCSDIAAQQINIHVLAAAETTCGFEDPSVRREEAQRTSVLVRRLLPHSRTRARLNNTLLRLWLYNTAPHSPSRTFPCIPLPCCTTRSPLIPTHLSLFLSTHHPPHSSHSRCLPRTASTCRWGWAAARASRGPARCAGSGSGCATATP
ncbi:hypothetical protein BJ546DRAFT_255217 [Cryomyces antarcticus]